MGPFKEGGIEVKATCGSVPTPQQCHAQGFQKPNQGVQRIECMRGYDWKAHHRETNNQIGVFWDFFNERPRIAAVFYSNTLTINDWGKIVQPKPGGGRTTSVSIMTRGGVAKMYEGWLIVLNDKRYMHFLDKYNKGNLLHQASNVAENIKLL
jgi:hypothetical protein